MNKSLLLLVAAVCGCASVRECVSGRPEPQFRIGVAGYTFCEVPLDKALGTMQAIDCNILAHKDFFLTGELLGELPTPAGVPTVEVQWKRIGMYYDSERFRMPAVMGAVWRNFEDTARYVVLVNISGEAQTFAYGTGSTRKTVTLSPRSVMSEVFPNGLSSMESEVPLYCNFDHAKQN